jgi:hypothetical protein
MSKNSVFVIRNHENRYLTRKHQWRSGNDRHLLFRSAEKDVALNEMIEVNARDILARLQLLACELDDRDQPVVEVLAEDPPELLEADQDEQKVTEAFARLAGKKNGGSALGLVQSDST